MGVEIRVVQSLKPQLLLLCSPCLKPRVSAVDDLGVAFGLPKIGGAILDTAICERDVFKAKIRALLNLQVFPFSVSAT